MCGITGFLRLRNSSKVGDDDLIQAMTTELGHRGPDSYGYFHDSEYGLSLGHRRLSILDLSANGNQPMVSKCQRYVLIFNGEIYNHLALRSELDRYGKTTFFWRGGSDTETLLACFTEYGIQNSINKIKGMFSIAVWDNHKKVITLIRDRIGEKPLYYGLNNGVLFFGSELKAIKKYPGFDRTISRDSLDLYLRYKYVPTPLSIYEGVYKLPQGNYLEIPWSFSSDISKLEPKSYWSINNCHEMAKHRSSLSEADVLERLEQLIHDAVKSQMMADVDLGCLLSSGIDSSLIAAVMQANSDKRINTFTIGFDEKEYDESSGASNIAAHLGVNHHQIFLSANDVLGIVPKISSVYDEPFSDSSQLPTYLVSKFAKQSVSVVLSGDGGDELFGGYNRYLFVPKVVSRFGWLPFLLRDLIGRGLVESSFLLNSDFGKKVGERLGVATISDKLFKLGERMVFAHSSNDLFNSLLTDWPSSPPPVLGSDVSPHFFHNIGLWPNVVNPVEKMMIVDLLTYLPDDVMVKVDRASMSNSLEARSPFLDRDLVEYAVSMPTKYKVRNGTTKWALRKLLANYIPNHLIGGSKKGFAVPLDSWLRADLRDWAENLLSAERLEREGYFSVNQVRNLWDAHLSGKYSYGNKLWSILIFQNWLDAELKDGG